MAQLYSWPTVINYVCLDCWTTTKQVHGIITNNNIDYRSYTVLVWKSVCLGSVQAERMQKPTF